MTPGSPVLVEQNPSKLNVAAQKSTTTAPDSQRKFHAATLPRRASSVLSDSLQSVQHHTVHDRSTRALQDDDIPEWKRRLARGEDIVGQGCDLFGPSRLEGMFKAPPTTQDENQPLTSPSFDRPRLWSMPSASPAISTLDHFQSMKASRSRLRGLDIVEEVNEEADAPHVGSRAGKAVAQKDFLHGFAELRTSSFELANSLESQKPGFQPSISDSLDDVDLSRLHRDPRIRTISGQEELRNEWISPVSLPSQNSIRGRGLKNSLDDSTAGLQDKLEKLGIDESQRPLSRSSDHGYCDKSVHDEAGADLTSQSLPDDLSMGTQEFISRGEFVNHRRGGFSNEDFFHRKTLSQSAASTQRNTSVKSTSPISHSSPVLPATLSQTAQEGYPPTPPTSTEAHQNMEPSMSSPLKLFGNRDTYTNNKLLRVLSHFEDAEAVGDGDPKHLEPVNAVEGELRMSQFGQGELDQYDFVEELKLKVRDDAQGDDLNSHLFSGLVDSEPLYSASPLFKDRSSDMAGGQRNFQSAFAAKQGIDNLDADQTKRDQTSPLKERTPKRRRTLHRQEIEVQLPRQPDDELVIRGPSKLAGTKRKDARYDDAASTIDPLNIAGREMLRPRVTHRRASNTASVDNIAAANADVEVHASTNPASLDVRAAVAEELVQVVEDARKTSVTTKDYMQEATKIMNMIRAKGKPKNSVGPGLKPDGTPDPNVDEVSSGDEFSRPPSRNGWRDLREQRRQQPHDQRIASHLRKFKESDDLEPLIDTFALEPTFVSDNAQAEEAALVPIPEDEERSSPANIRIRDSIDMKRKRKHSSSSAEHLHDVIPSTHGSSASSTQRTVPTSSTSSSGLKGVINPGKVQIPDQVGAMTFDHATKRWVKERMAVNLSAPDRRGRQATSEEDPFEHISDLSTDEQREALHSNEPETSDVSRPSTRGSHSDNDHSISAKINAEALKTIAGTARAMTGSQTIAHSQLAEHEKRIHNGLVSQAPNSPGHVDRQPRVVTIAFSSPLVSAVAYQDDPSTSELEVNQTAHVSQGSQQIGDTGNDNLAANRRLKQEIAKTEKSDSICFPYKSWATQSFVGRPVSRIEEQDEIAADEDMSLIRTSKSQAMTPVPYQSRDNLAVPQTEGKASSIICLTPLSEFSLHQVDRPSHEEASFVAPRRHSAALRQAHGSLALSVDDMMKAITDVEPSEPYWDHIRRLDLTGKRLTTLHRLEEYCSMLEELTISDNELGQLSGVPLSVRTLDVHKNCLSNLTSWSHLQNLQYLNISGNELESLEGLSCLYHLRELNANNNKISDIDGILDLNGLQCLQLRGNKLESLDFEGGELTRLTRLDASRNQLASVANLSWLPALEDLILEKNNLTEFAHSDQAPLVALRHLHISGNRLKTIGLLACPNIESLYLDRNNVTEVRSLDRARHLHTLSLREQANSPDIIGHVLSIPNDCRKIYLSSNSVRGGKLGLPTKPLFSLRYLELASCGISSVAAGFGARIPNCRVLNLNFNALGCVSYLQGIFHLNKLLLAGNRLERLRRSCLALSKHPTLTKVDLRNNPLTVGFYSPAPVENRLVMRCSSQSGPAILQDPYVLPEQLKEVDHKWVRLLDEGTCLRRRTIELLLAQMCIHLVELNGLAFKRHEILQPDELWETLTGLGVLKRPGLPPRKPISNSQPVDDVPTGIFDEYGSLMIEGEESV